MSSGTGVFAAFEGVTGSLLLSGRALHAQHGGYDRRGHDIGERATIRRHKLVMDLTFIHDKKPQFLKRRTQGARRVALEGDDFLQPSRLTAANPT